jgi:hypothetical protein
MPAHLIKPIVDMGCVTEPHAYDLAPKPINLYESISVVVVQADVALQNPRAEVSQHNMAPYLTPRPAKQARLFDSNGQLHPFQ